MKKLSLFAALLAVAVAVPLGIGSSHREAPSIMLDASADNTDLYAFTAPEAANKLTVVANWIPLEEPAGGPYFGKLDPKARYFVKIDNTGDGREDVAYRWQFRNRFRNPNSFLYAAPPVSSVNDTNLNFVQTYDLFYDRFRGGLRISSRKIADDVPVAPDNVGPKTMPNYPAISNSAIVTVPPGGKSWVGPADDAFFVDLGAIFDGINIDKPGRPSIGLGNQGGGKDDVSSYNVHSFVLQVPESQVTKNGQPVSGPGASNAVIGVWATTERRRVFVNKGVATSRFVQVSRLGNPLINEVIIPIGQKDRFNRTPPRGDAVKFGTFALNPEPARLLNALFNLGVKENDRTDIVQALLTGIPGLTQIGNNPKAADTLKLNLGVAPTTSPNRFGLLANDAAGFPNGRRLADDVTDIELRVIAGALLPASQGGKQIPLGDGVDRNDKPFRTTFPYVALPTDGFSGVIEKRVEPPHSPDPQPPS